MAEIIYSKNGTAKATAKSVRYTGQFMGVPQLEVEIDGPVPLGFEVGDYIVFSYDGIRYSIMDLPPVTKQASAGSTGDAFVYDSVVFKSPLGLLANVDFLDTVLNENDVHYSTLPIFEFYGTVKDFADRLQANINRLHTGWKVSVEGYDDSTNPNYDTLHEYNNISISNIKCSDSLSIPYETWGITYVFMVDAEGNNCIVFNHALDSTSAKRYGEGNGLYALTKRMSTEKPVANRLRAYGSTDNLPARYYNNLDGIDEGIYLPNLMIPRSKWKNQNDPITAYIDSTDIDENDTSMSRYGVREKSIYFDGSNDTEKIEPTIKGVTAGMIRAAKEEMGDTSNVPSATLYPDDERMDKILSCENPDDDGLTREGEKLYSTSVDFNVISGGDKNIQGNPLTHNNIWYFVKFNTGIVIDTDLVIDTPAIYRIDEKHNHVGNTPIASIDVSGQYRGLEWGKKGDMPDSYVDYVKMDVLTIDGNGKETVCAENIQLTWEINTHSINGENRLMLDLFFAGGLANDVSTYFSIPYKGTVRFRVTLSFGCYSTRQYGNSIIQTNGILMTASRGAIIQEKTFKVYIKQIGFNIEDYASAEEAKLVVNSGPCAGRSFNIKKNSCKLYGEYDMTVNPPVYRIAGWSLECFRSLDESISQYFPNNIFTIDEGDEFVLTGLEMPDLYVQMASQKLYDEAVKWLWKHKDGLEVFDLDIDNKVAYLDSVKIKEGMLLPLYDENLNMGSKTENTEGNTVITYDYRIIDSVTIEIGEESIPVITAVLREDKEESVYKSLRKTVQDISRRTTQNVIRMQVFNIAEEVVRNNAPAQSPGAGDTINSADFVTLSTEQTIIGKKTFAKDVVFGADGSRLFIPSGDTPGTYDIFVNPGMAVEGEDPSAGGTETETEVYRLNGLTALAAGASSSAIENAIGSFSGLLEAVRAGMVIIDVPDAANGERKTAVWAMTSGSILVGMDFHTAPGKVTRYAVTNVASGLTLAIRAYSLLTEDGTLNGLSTDAKTVPGAINELHEKVGNGGAYLLNGVFANLSETSSDAEIKATIGSYDALRQAIVDRRVILDNYNVDYDSSPITVLQATDGGDEDFISLTAMNAEKYRSITIMRGADGTLSVSGMLERSWLSDEAYGQLNTENKTVLGAINELAEKASEGGGGGASPFWYGRVSATGTATKLGGTGTVTVTRTSEGLYSIPGLPGRIVIVTPLNYHALSILQQSMHTALVTQETSTGSATVNMFGADGTRDDYGFFMLII